MSMSTLGNQLAALNSVSQGGSALPTSRRQDDAVGRGMYHNVQVGHSVVDTTKSHIYKASILFPDARQASNVPLTTLQENAISALEELESLDPLFGESIDQLCRNQSFERGLQTKADNDQIDITIQDLLYRLALRMTTPSDSSNVNGNVDVVNCGLNVVEYFIRKYDLHLRPKLISTMLLVWLPHHEHAYFLRWLQLVDLANLPAYAWLRPYAVPNAKVGRNAIANAATKNLALFRDLLLLTTKAAALPGADATLSFTAAVLVEAMTLQQRSMGTMDERSCQALLPTIKRACLVAPKNTLYANWGYIMASTLVETSCLADEPRKGLITSILQGLSKTGKKKSVGKMSSSRASTEDAIDAMDIEVSSSSHPRIDPDTVQNGLIGVLSLLQQQPPVSMESLKEDEQSNINTQLSVGSNNNKRNLYGFRNPTCINDKTIWQVLLEIDRLPDRLAQLLVEDGYTDMLHWIASLFVVGWKRLGRGRQKHSKSKSKKQQQVALEQFLRDLLQDVNLDKAVWSKPEWIEALVSFVLTNTVIEDQSNKQDKNPFLDETLQLLRSKNASSYDRGVAQALLQLKRMERGNVAAYLGLVKDKDGSVLMGNPSEAETRIQLPARVALEHADVEIRLEAIDRVIESNEEKKEGGETVLEALMRRVLVDSDVQVAINAAIKISQLLEEKKTKNKTAKQKLDDQSWVAFVQDALQSLYRWTEQTQVEHKSRTTLLGHVLHVLGLAAASIRNGPQVDGLMTEVVEAIGAFLVHDETAIVTEASKGIVMALTGKKGSPASENKARACLISHSNSMLRQFARDEETLSLNPSHKIFRRRLIRSVLKGYTETLTPRTNKGDFEQSSAALDYCLWVIKTHCSSLSNDNQRLLLDVLKRTKGQVSSNPTQLWTIVSVLSEVDEDNFKELCCPFLTEVCTSIEDKNGENVPGIAVVCEMALRAFDTAGQQIERLLLIVENLISLNAKKCHLALVPLLALLVHSEVSVRKSAIDLIANVKKQLTSNEIEKWKPLVEICESVSTKKYSAVMGSPELLASCLKNGAVEGSDAEDLQSLLLELVLCFIMGGSVKGSNDQDATSIGGWLEFENLQGGHCAALIVLRALEEAGETAFPLLTRWRIVGKPVLEFVRKNEYRSPVPHISAMLLDRITLMLNAKIMLSQAETPFESSVIITSGPAFRGGRKRSYSFGKGEPSDFLHPYPQEMTSAISDLLSDDGSSAALREVRNTICQKIMVKESWTSAVFSSLSHGDRKQVTSALLHTMTHDLAEGAEEAFFVLPLSCQDVAKLLEQQSTGDDDFAFISYLADFISANCGKLVTDQAFVDILVAVFEKLSTLSFKASGESDGVEFVRTALLGAVIEVLEAMPEETRKKLSINKKKKFKDWVGMLVGLVSASADSKYRPVESTRSKKSALYSLTIFCSLYPILVAPKLISAIDAMVLGTTTEKEAAITADCLGSAVPVYFQYYAVANLTPSDLIDGFIKASNSGIEGSIRNILYQGFVDALSTKAQSETTFMGAFLASTLAADVFFSERPGVPTHSSTMISQIITQVDAETRTQALLVLISYARDLVLMLGGTQTKQSAAVTLEHLTLVATRGPARDGGSERTTEATLSSKRKLCIALMVATCEMLTTSVFARFLRHCHTENSASIVQLWEDLLLIQSVFNNELGTSDGDGHSFWTSVSEVTSEALGFIQQHLPSHIFLAFATSLVKESESEELRSRALQMVADRSLLLDSSDPESALFLEMLPYLISLADSTDSADQLLVPQSAFLAVEHIVRSLCFDKDGPGAKYIENISSALAASGQVIERFCKLVGSYNLTSASLDSPSAQLLCTATLCAATTVRVCGARALPSLPRLLRPSLKMLNEINKYMNELNHGRTDDVHAEALQLSVLRMAGAIVDTIPQFLAPYIDALFQQSTLPAAALRRSGSEQQAAVKEATRKLCENIAIKIPARHLLLPLSTSMAKADSVACLLSLLDIMAKSINNSKASEISGKVNSILNAATTAFDYAENLREQQSELIESAVKMFMAAVMKLSEVQLRALYSKLRVWRRDLAKTKPAEGAFRRLCFWLLSARLGTNLKSIFLPCFASVFSDAIEELDTSLSFLYNRSGNGVKTSGGTKKQRIETDITEYDDASLRSLQALLKCVEVCLRADAHDGGSWIRDGDAERFDLILEPLTKLMQCRVEDRGNEAPTYQELVQGNTDDSGSVVECLVAVALAAGDENKWKPLNHAVLQACSHETRREVRKAGIACLLSLVKSIGEEYMVLIPECLPVLSELLEESDEEISGSAQECITISEDLLGESLEDSLR